MNTLKDIKIRGDIFSEYAFLSYTLSFESSENVSAEYVFTLPNSSLISSFKLFLNGKIIETKITSACHTAVLTEGEVAFATLRRIRNDEYILTLDSLDSEGLTIMLSVYAPLREGRLSLPLAKKGTGNNNAVHTAEVTLNAISASSASSPTHQIITEAINGGIRITSGAISATKDFCIDTIQKEKHTSGILQKNITGGELLVKLYPTINIPTNKSILFVYDTENITSKSASIMARDFILRGATVYDGKSLVAISENIIWNSENNSHINSLTEVLSHIDYEICHTNVLTKASHDIIVMLTERPEIYSGQKNVYTVSPGITSSTGYHIYPKDDLQMQADNIIRDILYKESLKVYALKSSNGDAYIVDSSAENGITAYITYMGAFPKFLTLSYGEYKENIFLENIRVYDSFAPIGLIRGSIEQNALYEKLKHCSPDEVLDIREKIEDIGIKYSILNSETALIGSLDKKPAPVRVVIPNQAESFSGNMVSMFRETRASVNESFLLRCIDFIIRNMRSDGAICTDGEINIKTRRNLTKVSLAALMLTDLDLRTYIEKAEEFLSFSFSDKSSAREYLSSIFKEKEEIPEEIRLDIITAAKVIWQS